MAKVMKTPRVKLQKTKKNKKSKSTPPAKSKVRKTPIAKRKSVAQGNRERHKSETLRMVHLDERNRKTWKPLSRNTLAYVTDIMEQNIRLTLNDFPDSYSEVNTALGKMKRHVLSKFAKLKVPVTHRSGSYAGTEKVLDFMNSEIHKNIRQAERMENKISRLEEICEELDDEKAKLEEEVSGPFRNKESQESEEEDEDLNIAIIDALAAVIQSMSSEPDDSINSGGSNE